MPAKILVVDDEEFIALTLKDIFEGMGYTADHALSGHEALAKAKSFCPDLLLSDVMMPGLNGFEAALQIKEFCPGCRLVFFSGYAGSDFLAQQFQSEFTRRGYHFNLLPKPVDPALLLRTVEEALLQEDKAPFGFSRSLRDSERGFSS
jgi:CheY-like chemotaxis protein